jgi:hypothetical protein
LVSSLDKIRNNWKQEDNEKEEYQRNFRNLFEAGIQKEADFLS